MKRIQSGFFVFLLFILFCSCNTQDFDLKKLSTTDITPKVYTALAYGTFNVKDYLPAVNLGADDAVINLPQIQLDPLSWRKGNFSFQKSALDSTAMEVTLTNGTPMKVLFGFSFTDYYSGITSGKTFSGIINPAITDNSGTVQPTVSKVVFQLDYNDLDVIGKTDGLKCLVTLQQPGTPVTVKSVKESTFKIQVNLRSRINLGKIN